MIRRIIFSLLMSLMIFLRPGACNNADAQMNYHIEQVNFTRGGQNIFGKMYLPESDSPIPVVILAHGFGANLSHLERYAVYFAENGIAACVFDFIGGGTNIHSDGLTTEMSVLTEAADLNAVIDALVQRDDLDSSSIFLMGGSQGGFVASYMAGKRPEDIKGLIALYPAYVIQDYAWSQTPDPENIPETMMLLGTPISKIYNADAMSFDIYDVIKNYTGDVLIIHGTQDYIAPISYSEKAITVFPSAELVKIEGAGHGFYGEEETYSAELAIQFVKNHLEKDENIDRGNEDMKMTIGNTSVKVDWENNESVNALKALTSEKPLTIQMSMYGGFEQVGPIGQSLPRNDVQTVTNSGDIVLYSGSQIVVFYGSNSWAYTRLGHISDKTAGEMAALLGNGNVTITIGQ